MHCTDDALAILLHKSAVTQVLDLHGLHIAEATVLLEEELPVLCTAGLSAVSIVTGSGHHSKGSNYKVSTLFMFKSITNVVQPYQSVTAAQ
jgi:Smr domain